MTAMPDVTMGSFKVWDFRVTVEHDENREKVEILARYRCTCVDTDPGPAEVSTREVVDEEFWDDLDEDMRARAIRDVVIRALSHDVDEWLRVDGKVVEVAHGNR